MSTLSFIEVLWLILSFLGIGISAVNLKDGRIDYLFAARARRDRATKVLIARNTVLLEAGRLTKHLLFLLAGALAATLPPDPGVGSPLPGWIIALLPLTFFLAQFIMIVSSFLSRQLRLQLLERVKQMRAQDEQEAA